MTPDMQQAWDGFKRLKGDRDSAHGWTDNACELSRLLGRIGATANPLADDDKAHQIDRAVTLANEMRAGLNTITDALSRIRAAQREAA